MGFASQATGTIRDLKQENEDGDTHCTKVTQVAGAGLKATALVQAGTDEAWPPSTSPNQSPDASRAPCCSHRRLLATSSLLGMCVPPCFWKHCSYFLQYSCSASDCPTLTLPQKPTHLYYPFSMKPTLRLYPTLYPIHGSVSLLVSSWEFSSFMCLESRGIMRMFRIGK